MGLVDTLRRAEEQARKAARAGMQRTIVGLDDAERAIRRRMRIYPNQMTAMRARAAAKTTVLTPRATESQPESEPELKKESKAS